MMLENKKKLEKVKALIDVNMTYKKFKYNGETYSVGDDVQICDYSSEFLIAKIIKIHAINGITKYSYWPTIEVNWYYKKDDIVKDKKYIQGLDLRSISDYEVFSSNHKDIIFIETLLGKCSVLSFEEYEKLEEINSNMFFTRAFYDPVKVRLVNYLIQTLQFYYLNLFL